ncbi:MAG TPA: hypothetical protein VMG58_16435 [Candidatus Sulfotelmatobacter sp.]|nr:hypothetical protein [Candidatus Sulfotelmatobacter sp.]
MRGRGILAGTLAAALMAWGGAALAADTATSHTTPTSHAKAEKYMIMHGEITAVQPDSVTLKEAGKGNELFKATMNDKTWIHEGKAKKGVNDLKVGERVAVRYNYDQATQANMADSIRILQKAPKA